MCTYVVAMTRVSGDAAEAESWARSAGVEDRLLVSPEISGVTTVAFIAGDDRSLEQAFVEQLKRPGADWAFQESELEFHQVS